MSDELLRWVVLGPNHNLKKTTTRLTNGGTRSVTDWVCTCGRRGTVLGGRAAAERAFSSHRIYS